MKKNCLLLFTILFIFGGIINAEDAISPYVTPGTGVSYTFDDLVANSKGAVVKVGDEYIMKANVTISKGDELKVLTDITVKIEAAIELVVSAGKFNVAAPTKAVFTAVNPETVYSTIKIEEGSYVRLNNAAFTYGSGIKVVDSDFVMDNCDMEFHKSSSQASGAIAAISGKVIVKNSRFKNNVRSAFNSGANIGCTFEISSCFLENNVTENSNRPQINLGPCREGEVTKIINNTIIGNRALVKVGGISTSSLLGTPTSYLIEGNTVKNNRYGITLTGSNITGTIKGNTLTDNNTENNPALGGSGINITASAGNTHAIITGNTISGHLWGITLVGNTKDYKTGPTANIGNITVEESHSDYNPGLNVFNKNGNGDVLCDLYNNTPNDVMAQNNTWGVMVQDEASISQVVVDKADDSRYGTVIFMPAFGNEVDVVETPFNLSIAEKTATERVFSWNNTAMEDGFEEHDDFTINSPGKIGWNYIDVDKKPTYAIEGFKYNNNGSPMAFMVFTPSKTTPALPSGWNPHTGKKMLVSFAATGAANNDWIVSPELTMGREMVIEFWTLSLTGNYGLERFKVAYSTADKKAPDFTNILSEGDYVEAPLQKWTKYSYVVPADAKYVGINYLSKDAFAFVIDDISISSSPAGRAFVNYTVYLDGEEVSTTTETTYTFTGLTDGDHIAGVKSVYSEKSSEVVTIPFKVILTKVDDIDELSLNIYPNPAHDFVNIDGEYTLLHIYNIAGKLLMTVNSENKIDVSNLPSGTYILKAYNNEKVVTYKMIK